MNRTFADRVKLVCTQAIMNKRVHGQMATTTCGRPG